MLNVYLRHSKLESRYVTEVSDCGINIVREDAWTEYERFVVWTACGFYVCERIQRRSKSPLAFEVQSFDSLCSALRCGTSKFCIQDGREYVEYDAQKVLTASRLFNFSDLYSSYGDSVLPSGVRKYESADMSIGDNLIIAVLFRGSLFSCEYVDAPAASDYVACTLSEACHRALVSDGELWTFRDHITGEDVYCLLKAVAS